MKGSAMENNLTAAEKTIEESSTLKAELERKGAEMRTNLLKADR
jgi:hypothetical protein